MTTLNTNLNPAVPNLPLATATYEKRYVDQLNNVLRLYFNQLNTLGATLSANETTLQSEIDAINTQIADIQAQITYIQSEIDAINTELGTILDLPCGGFQDNTTQTAASANVAYPITFGTTDFSNGVSIGTPTSRIVIATPARYNFQFSIQLDKSAGSAANIWIWPRVNGINVTDSASKIAIQGTAAETIAAWNFVLDMETAGDYFELMWLTDDNNVELKHEAGFGTAPNDVPEIPSVILTVTFVSTLPA